MREQDAPDTLVEASDYTRAYGSGGTGRSGGGAAYAPPAGPGSLPAGASFLRLYVSTPAPAHIFKGLAAPLYGC